MSFRDFITIGKNPIVSGALTFIILAIAGTYVTYLAYRVETKFQENEMLSLLSNAEKNIDYALRQGYGAALTMSLTIDNNGVPQNFDSVAKQVLEVTEILDGVELVPGGVIKYIYPVEGNEPALNYDILADTSRNKEAIKAIEKNALFFAGPLELKQGGTAVVGRLPVNRQGKFWGFSAVIISLEQLLELSGIEEGMPSYNFQLTKINPDTGVEEKYLESDFPLETAQSISIPEGDWVIYASPKESYQFLMSNIPIAIIGLVMSLFGSFFVYELVNRPKLLRQQLIDRSRDLIASERKFRTIFQQSAIGVALIDATTGRFIEVNEKHSSLTGYSTEEIKEFNYIEVSHEDDREISKRKVEDLKAGVIRSFSLEKRVIKKSGEPVWTRISVSPLWKKTESPTLFISLIEDISEQKQNQQRILESSLQAQEKEKNRIAAELHDGIVQEMVACIMQCESLLKLVGSDKELERRVKDLHSLIKKITVDTRNISHNLLSADMERMSFSELIERLEMQLKVNTSIDIRFESLLEDEEKIPEEVIINVYRAIQELSTNIIKHSKASVAQISVEQIKDTIYISVRDNGVGVKSSNSMGIGSYNVKNRVFRLGGEIEYRHPEKGGLEVSISIPLTQKS